jgi:hypothetical protein
MFGLRFENHQPIVVGHPNRADIACFVGFVARRPHQAAPDGLRRWLGERGWLQPPYGKAVTLVAAEPLSDPLELDGNHNELTVEVNGVTQQLRLPTGSQSLASLLAGLQQGLWQGVVTLQSDNRLAFTAEWATSLRIRRNPSLGFAVDARADHDLLDLPIPIDTWESFDQLLAWDRRPLGASGQWAATYLGAAVRSFFAQGGRKCYVVRVGDPWPLVSTPASNEERRQTLTARLQQLMPGYPNRIDASAVDQASWHGVGHLLGLPDVAFLSLPDLPEIVASAPLPPSEVVQPPDSVPEQFVECADAPPTTPVPETARLGAPRCHVEDYQSWAGALHLLADGLLRQHARNVQLVAALPLPHPNTRPDQHPLAFLVNQGRGPLANTLAEETQIGLASAFVQLVYPWISTSGSGNLPEQLENPEGVLVGLLARNALARGAYRSAARQRLGDVYRLFPVLTQAQIEEAVLDHPVRRTASHALIQRVTLLGRTPDGLQLLSDVTTALDESYRQAAVNRLVSILVRSAASLGEQWLFEPAGERLWSAVRTAMNRLLLGLLRGGALRGATPEEAFQVRCDRSTMTQNDIDNGRLITEVNFVATSAIEQITVVLALDEGGQVTVTNN